MIIQRLPRQCSVPSRGCECSQRTTTIVHCFQTSKFTCSHILLFHTYNYRMQRITYARLPSRTIHDIGTTVKGSEGRRETHGPKSITIKKARIHRNSPKERGDSSRQRHRAGYPKIHHTSGSVRPHKRSYTGSLVRQGEACRCGMSYHSSTHCRIPHRPSCNPEPVNK
jgi:hypothetical protein